MSDVDESIDESEESHWDDDDDDEDDDDYDCDTGEEEEEEENGRLLLAAKVASVYGRHYSCGVDSSSDRNEYEQYFLRGKGDWCVGPITLPP